MKGVEEFAIVALGLVLAYFDGGVKFAHGNSDADRRIVFEVAVDVVSLDGVIFLIVVTRFIIETRIVGVGTERADGCHVFLLGGGIDGVVVVVTVET